MHNHGDDDEYVKSALKIINVANGLISGTIEIAKGNLCPPFEFP